MAVVPAGTAAEVEADVGDEVNKPSQLTLNPQALP